MEFFATIGVMSLFICLYLWVKAWAEENDPAKKKDDDVGDYDEPASYPATPADMNEIFKRQTRYINPEFQFDLENPMSARFGNSDKLPYMKSFDILIDNARETLDYLHTIAYAKIAYSDITIPTRWLIQRDEAELDLKCTLKKATRAYELHTGTPQTTEIRRLYSEATKSLNELLRIEDAVRELLAVKSPKDRPLPPKAPI